MKRVKLVKLKDDKVYKNARVKLNKADVNVDEVDDTAAEREALISERMRAKWVPGNDEPKMVVNMKDLRSNIPGVKRRNQIKRKEFYADPFAYNNDRHPATVYRLRLLGHSAERIAEIFMVGKTTINTWRTNFPDFNRAWLEGGEEADAVVAQSLFRRAVGWQHQSEKIHFTADGAIIRAPFTEKFAPDTSAAKFWLTNRQGGKKGAWNDKKEVSHSVNVPPTFVVNPVSPMQIAPPPTLEAGTFRAMSDPDMVNTAYNYEDGEEDV